MDNSLTIYMRPNLEDIIWKCLSGPQRHFCVGTESVLRYAPVFSPIVVFANPDTADINALIPFCEPGESFYCDNWTGPIPTGWEIIVEKQMKKLIFEGDVPLEDPAPEAVRLTSEHMVAACELTALTNPGPFGRRTLELGEYFGMFDGGRLVAMAGERFLSGNLREISAVCTHPDYQGRGLAQKLTGKLIYRQAQRGEQTFLHVVSENMVALKLYRKLGFVETNETTLRVVKRVC